jgi:hypothetical protein
MSDQLTPAQEALAGPYVAKYTAIGLRTTPENTQDRAIAAKAAEAFLRADANFNQSRTCIHIDTASDPDLTLALGPNHEGQDMKAMYIVTGTWPHLVALAKKFTGKDDVSDAFCVSQYAAHAPAHATFMRDVLGVKGIDVQTDALDGFSRHCGVTLIYEKAIFVGDPPVAFKETADGKLDPIYTNAEAHQAGLTTPEGLPLADA